MRAPLFVLLFAGFVLPVLAEYHVAEKPQAGEGEMLVSEPGRAQLTRLLTLTARIEGIDADARKLTLLAPDGQSVEYVADDDVRNFDQIEVGDMVELNVLQSLRLELVTAGKDAAPEGKGAMARAEPGAKPGAAVGSRVTFMTDVVRVDREANVISLKDPDGSVVDFDVQNPAQFDVVRVGDKVRATYTEAIALEVRPME